jgi:hypothetical protein
MEAMHFSNPWSLRQYYGEDAGNVNLELVSDVVEKRTGNGLPASAYSRAPPGFHA